MDLSWAGGGGWESRKEKVAFWEKVKGNVAAGRLGMVGVFLGREGAGEEEGGEDWEDGDILKVYCWGKVVDLVWAFLFVVSNRRTKYGLRWVDAAGVVVLQC